MTEDILTFDELRRAQSREREMDTLQELDEDFFGRARNYLDLKKDPDNHLENREYRNAKHILEDVLDMRQKKIVKLAFLSVKSNIQVEHLLTHEESLFNEVRDMIATYRREEYGSILDGADTPQTSSDTEPEPVSDPEEEDTDTESEDADTEPAAETEDDAAAPATDTETSEADNTAPDERAETATTESEEPEAETSASEQKRETTIFGGNQNGTESPSDAQDSTENSGADEQAETEPATDAAEDDDEHGEEEGLAQISITERVPEFMGVDLNPYGPFDEGDTAHVPEKNAEVLVNQGKAEHQ